MTGPVFITIGGKERRLRYDINAAAEKESLIQPTNGFLTGLSQGCLLPYGKQQIMCQTVYSINRIVA